VEPKRKVIIFEDNQNIQLLLKFFFQKRGFQVHVANDGEDAVSLAREHQPDLILMDVLMPGKGGVEACGDLRRAGIKTPIVMLTSKSYPDDKAFALQAGASAYLLKPFNTAEMEAAILPLLPS